MHLDEFAAHLKFPLDEFQHQACQAVENDHGVLVCAPTGAGKTIIGEFAVSLALSRGTKCFYTTPIKALSNQKYHDLVAAHGPETIGLLTGDTTINHNADILVMTTEVLRNMIYAQSPTFDRLTHVVMDEIHYLSDKTRGSVWEEIILGLHDSIKIIGLSATVSNSEEFGHWLTTVRGNTDIIVTDHRPVPLNQWMLVGTTLHPLFEPNTTTLNHQLATHINKLEHTYQDNHPTFRTRSTNPNHTTQPPKPNYRPLGRPEVTTILAANNMLPAITFIFSRIGCDSALAQCLRSRINLTTPEEINRIKHIIDTNITTIPEEDLKVLGYRNWRTALTRGFAAHHAGMLPAFRHIVEELFVNGLLKVVFATETLALGINMPARTVVLEKLVKFDGEGHADLTPGQYTQLTGRAGRRGIDVLGNAVVQWSPAMDPQQVANLASTRTYPLVSTFTPGYNMSVNLLKTMGFTAAHHLLEMSFAQFQANKSIVGHAHQVEKAEQRVRELEQQLEEELAARQVPSEQPLAEFLEYMQLQRDLSLEERNAKKLRIRQRREAVTAVLSKVRVGDVLALSTKKRPVLAVVVKAPGRPADPRVGIIMESGWRGTVEVDDFAVPPKVVSHMRLGGYHKTMDTKQVVKNLKKYAHSRPKKLRAATTDKLTKKALALHAAVRGHPVRYWQQVDDLTQIGHDIIRARTEVDKLHATVDASVDTLGKEFDRILGLLAELDYVEYVDGDRNNPRVSEEGERLALIHSECDLLVAQCLRRGIWDGLDPAELAGVVSLCTFENRRETRGEPIGATDAMADAMDNTIRLWEELHSDERRHQLPETRYPDSGFALAIHQWAAGAPLGYCMAAAAECGAELTPGDFVRQARQVVDLLEQVRKTGYHEDTIWAARHAVDAIRRGVVAIGA